MRHLRCRSNFIALFFAFALPYFSLAFTLARMNPRYKTTPRRLAGTPRATEMVYLSPTMAQQTKNHPKLRMARVKGTYPIPEFQAQVPEE